MQLIPLISTPSQTLTVALAGQQCLLHVYQRRSGLYVDVSVFQNFASQGTLIVGGVVAENLNRIVRSVYLGFIGDLIFDDAQGTNDPDYTGLGTGGRYEFLYLSADDLVTLGLVG